LDKVVLGLLAPLPIQAEEKLICAECCEYAEISTGYERPLADE
jgi:hypothetical protein